MSEPWMMYAAVLFGIGVAVAGVAAYLRMTRSGKSGIPSVLTDKRTLKEDSGENIRDFAEQKEKKD